MKQVSAKQMLYGAIIYSFAAGGNTVLGIGYLMRRPAQLQGIAFLALAIAFCGLATRCGRMLMKNGSRQSPDSF